MLVEVENLRVSIDGANILNGVSLNINKGDIYGLLGPNGAGKTTTIFAILGLYEPSFDKLNILGKKLDVNSNSIRSHIGVMPEDAGFYEWMKALEYLGWISNLYGVENDIAKLENLLEIVGLSDAKNKYISQYSRGMKQRLSLAKALVNDPKLLILDEPTNGLDPRGRKDIHDLFISLAKEKNIGILLSTHILEDVDRLCNKIGIINKGETVIEGELSNLLSNVTENIFIYKIRTEENLFSDFKLPQGVSILKKEGSWYHLSVNSKIYSSISNLWKDFFQKGLKILEIQLISGGLEDLYMRYTSVDDQNNTGDTK